MSKAWAFGVASVNLGKTPNPQGLGFTYTLAGDLTTITISVTIAVYILSTITTTSLHISNIATSLFIGATNTKPQTLNPQLHMHLPLLRVPKFS